MSSRVRGLRIALLLLAVAVPLRGSVPCSSATRSISGAGRSAGSATEATPTTPCWLRHQRPIKTDGFTVNMDGDCSGRLGPCYPDF